MSGGSDEIKTFPLTLFGTKVDVPFGSTQNNVIEYIKNTKGGSGGAFLALYKDGRKVPLFEDVFIENANILGYEFVPKDEPATATAAVQGPADKGDTLVPLYELSDPPSSVKKNDIDRYQRDHTYYSPCSNAFVLTATCLAYENIPPATMHDDEMTNLAGNLVYDIETTLGSSKPHYFGYCSQENMAETGITALLTANLEKCYSHYCSLLLQLQLQEPAMHQLQSKRTFLMHQSAVTEPKSGSIDVGWFYRFEVTDQSFFRKGKKALYPMGFIEFTKSTTKSILDKVPQASAYANALFRMMKFKGMKTWVPLLGVVMSESEFVVKLYSLTIVDITEHFESKKQWKIAEVVIEKFKVNSASVMRLVHMMAGWVKYCVAFLTSESAKVRVRGAINEDVCLRESCIAFIDHHVFKCYDYRSISDRNVDEKIRRDPQWYYQLGDLNVETVVEWQSPQDNDDCLKIIRYPIIDGTHEPIYVKHLVLVMQALLHMHSQNAVHGDLRFANVVFSKADVSPLYSKLIDFDYSGIDGEREYPKRFNLGITDGNRHPEVKPGELLHKHHDVHSFAWMCSRYRPKSEDLRAFWQEWIDSEEGDLTRGLERFRNISDAEELVIKPAVPTFRVPRGYQGTGSPAMKVK